MCSQLSRASITCGLGSGSVRRLEPFSLLHLFDKNTSEWLCGSTSILGSSGCSSIPCLNSALHLQASTQLSLSPFRRGETDQLLKQATTQRGNGQWNSFELCAPSDCMANEFCPAVSKGSPQKKHRLGHWAPFWSLVAAAQWHPSSSVFSPWRSYIVILYTCFLYIHMCISYIYIYTYIHICVYKIHSMAHLIHGTDSTCGLALLSWGTITWESRKDQMIFQFQCRFNFPR